jgi:hypothetical protein
MERASKFAVAVLLYAATFTLPLTSVAQTFIVSNTVADAFLASGPGGGPSLAANNYGGAGTLAISPASSDKGEFDSVIMFNTGAAITTLNSDYGAGDWTITGLTLSLASNVGTQGANPGNAIFNTINAGNFEMDWLANNSWVEGTGTPNTPSATGVNFNSIPTLLSGSDILGTYTYTPPGNGIYASYTLPLDPNLVADAAAGGNVSLYFYATNGAVSFLFNSRSGSAPHPELTLDVTPTPEPATVSLLALSLGGLWLLSHRKKIS